MKNISRFIFLNNNLILLLLFIIIIINISSITCFNTSRLFHHNHHKESSSKEYYREKRSVPEFEATLNAMKCALRIVGLQVSEHHNNMFMCCGLWKLKSFMKETADRVCENPLESNRVFDNFMTDELIYGKFTHSILGDDTLDCKKYPEGSSTCERLFNLITFAIVMFFLLLTLLIFGCCLSSFCWYHNHHRYVHLLQHKHLFNEQDHLEKDSFLTDSTCTTTTTTAAAPTRRWMRNLRTYLPQIEQQQQMVDGRINGNHKSSKHLNNNNNININAKLSFPNPPPPPHHHSGRSTNVQQDKSSGKSTPDSIPPSTNSTTTSIISLNNVVDTTNITSTTKSSKI